MSNLIARAFAGPTVADQMTRYNNRSRGFDYLRVGLSLAVMVWHSFFLSSLTRASATSFSYAVHMILPLFFALSGFLVTGSLVRTATIREFITLRVVRIMPALAVEVLLSAFVIGVIFTTLPLGDYFTDPLFFTYLRNLYGDVHFHLPGVFEQNPVFLVNVSLWTIPYELQCYAAIVVLWLLGAVPNRKWLLVALVVVTQVALPLRDWINHDFANPEKNNLPGRLLVLAFLYGVIIYFFANRIVLRAWLAGLAALLCYVFLHWAGTMYLIALPAAYLTVFLGLTNPPKIPLIMHGDYSYGIYLYAGPMQQAVLALFPTHREWWFNLGCAVIPVCLFAAFSWHVVEKPVLGQRKRIIAAVLRVTGYVGAPFRRFRRRAPEPGSPMRHNV